MQGRNPTSAGRFRQAVPDAVEGEERRAAGARRSPEMVEPIKAAKPEPKAVAKPEPKKEAAAPRPHADTGRRGRRRLGARADERTARRFRSAGSRPAAAAAGAYTDFADFCCPEYHRRSMQQHDLRATGSEHQGAGGPNRMKFVVHRDGTHHRRVRSSRARVSSSISRRTRALEQTQQLPPLPTAFPTRSADGAPRIRIQAINDETDTPARLAAFAHDLRSSPSSAASSSRPRRRPPSQSQPEARSASRSPAAPALPPKLAIVPDSSRCRRTPRRWRPRRRSPTCCTTTSTTSASST